MRQISDDERDARNDAFREFCEGRLEEDPYANLTRDELVACGLLESEDYRDFAPPCEDDPEAYDEMVWQDRIARENGFPW